METLVALVSNPIILLALIVWELVWKGQALWLSAQKKDKVWFVILLVANTLGILPIIYLVLKKKKKA